jgi:hypothetical protein
VKTRRIATALILGWLGSSASTPSAADTSITLLRLNQPPCKTLTRADILQAKLAYHIADKEQSEYGFAVSIKFQSKDPRRTFSDGRQGRISVSKRDDELTLTYPMVAIRHSAQLYRPITCYFYLHRNTGPGRSTVIALTKPIVFQECQ